MPDHGRQEGHAMDTADIAFLSLAIAAFVAFAATLFFVSQEDSKRRNGRQFVQDSGAANDDSYQATRRAA
jgi:hypothetical protein